MRKKISLFYIEQLGMERYYLMWQAQQHLFCIDKLTAEKRRTTSDYILLSMTGPNDKAAEYQGWELRADLHWGAV